MTRSPAGRPHVTLAATVDCDERRHGQPGLPPGGLRPHRLARWHDADLQRGPL
jgi:hypothetical protein